MSNVISHPAVENQPGTQYAEQMKAFEASFEGSAAHAAGAAAMEDVEAQALAEARAIAESQVHRVTSGQAVGFAKVKQPGLQLTEMTEADREAYVQNRQQQYAMQTRNAHDLYHYNKSEDGEDKA